MSARGRLVEPDRCTDADLDNFLRGAKRCGFIFGFSFPSAWHLPPFIATNNADDPNYSMALFPNRETMERINQVMVAEKIEWAAMTLPATTWRGKGTPSEREAVEYCLGMMPLIDANLIRATQSKGGLDA
jgi:hypothetical protein